MPKEIDGVSYFTQDELNSTVGQVRTDARSTGEKNILKTLGFEKAEEAAEFVKKAKETQAASQTDAEKLQADLKKAAEDRDAAVRTAQSLTLESKAIDAGAKLGLTVPKAKQVLRLVNVPEGFDFEKGSLDETFKTFLDLPENAHFKTGTELPVTPGRKPGDPVASSDGKKDKFEELKGRFNFG
jgi:hypothetical protein